MKGWILAVCLTVCLAAVGQAEERDPKAFYFDGGLKVKSVEHTTQLWETLMGIHVWEFEVELPKPNARLECEVMQTSGKGHRKITPTDIPPASSTAEPSLQSLSASFGFMPSTALTNPTNAKGRLTVCLAPVDKNQELPGIQGAEKLRVFMSFSNAGATNSSSRAIENPFKEYNGVGRFEPVIPNSGSVPRHRKDAIYIMSGNSKKGQNPEQPEYTDIFLRFTTN